MSNPETDDLCKISLEAIKKNKSNILKKSGTTNITEIATSNITNKNFY
jgi:DNA-binding CsgD family transcriptional regulator